jgi:predicted RNA binding protein YcfA (HicA-like mRNA interferase family)
MAKKQDDLTWLKKNKMGVRFNDLEHLLKQHGWHHQSTTGSHHVYAKAGCLPIMVVKPHGKQKYCHPMDVNKVIAALDAQEEAKEEAEEPENEQETES